MRKIALITGCAKGIGKEIALDLARTGYNIIATYNRSLKEINELKSKIENIGVNFQFYKLDLRNEVNINNVCNKIKEKYKNIDVLVNNAALSLDNSFLDKTKEEFMKVLEVNLVGPFLLIQKLNNLLINSKIINISSTDGINTYSKLSMDYSASKAGLINLTKSLALELENAKVYALCPNWVNTESIREMNPDYLKEEMNRVGQKKLIEPKEVSHKVLDIIESDMQSGSIIVMEG
jgi:3-oxoacyl-[acyl-carrier protein] reductase